MHKLLDKRKVHYLVAICMKKNQKFNGLARFVLQKCFFFVFRVITLSIIIKVS